LHFISFFTQIFEIVLGFAASLGERERVSCRLSVEGISSSNIKVNGAGGVEEKDGTWKRQRKRELFTE
jgi:hypothetical protein